MAGHLDALKPQERAACLIAERVLGASAEAWDVNGRQGEVDAMLTLADGRKAAFEVTAVAGEGALHLAALLARTDFEWPVVGEWWWDIQVGSVRDLPRLRRCYRSVIEQCERDGVQRPENLLQRTIDLNPDLHWLTEESNSTMWGHPEVPAVEGNRVRPVMVVPMGRGGRVDHSLAGLCGALEELFQQGHMPAHLAKTAGAPGQERHLFLALHLTALPFGVMDALMLGEALPPQPPPLPAEVTHLWLAPAFSRRVLLWADGSWQSHHPYDDLHPQGA